jgi:ABC-type sugar transport system ATPase subunit
VWKYYGDVLAVEDVSWKCADGEFFSILGPSGCGKSSTLRMIAGLEEISAGDILFDGRRVNDLHPSERNIAMVFETWALYPNMSVFDNIAFPLWVRNQPKDEIERQVHWAAEFLGLEEILDSGVRGLSGGQKQRVSIGRAIVREPEVLIMDEPISHLDAGLRARMREELEDQVRRLGVTTLYITHDQVESMAMADRIAVMHKGQIQQIGSPKQIYARPTNEFVAGFIGEPPMNFADCSLQFGGDQPRLISESFSIAFPEALLKNLKAQEGVEDLRLGIRPDCVKLDVGGENIVRAEVDFVEPQGDRTIITVRLSGGEMFLIEAGTGDRPQVGVPIDLRFELEHAHLFDRGTGVNLLFA